MIQSRYQPAPLFNDIADGPEDGEAFWLHASDGVRLRVGVWGKTETKGTVLLLPGRTEYVEKYGRAAVDLKQRGYATVVIDWRGQGLADRALADRMVGHVDHFSEFQLDYQALEQFALDLGLPQPFYMIAHSMGGCIGLRALMGQTQIKAAAFSAPMWGILMAAWMRPVASVISNVAGWVGQAHRFAPGTSDQSYVAEAAFGGNVLTTDPEMWRYMQQQIQDHPELSLAGPSLGWLRAALTECMALTYAPSPTCPTLTALGSVEKVVDPAPIHMRMARWPNGKLEMFAGAEHEIIMEAPAHRARFFDMVAALFEKTR